METQCRGWGRAAEEIVVAAIQEDVDLTALCPGGKKARFTRFFTRRIAETAVSRNALSALGSLQIEPPHRVHASPHRVASARA